MVELTEEIINSGKSQNGGWSLNQLSVFGVFEFKKGWKKQLIGKKFTESEIEKFISMRNKHLEKIKIKTYTDTLKINTDIPNSEQYLNPKWISLKQTVLQRDKNSCQKCGKTKTELHVHHLIYEKDKFIWEIDLEYLITLCRNCHELIHNRKI